MEKLILALQLNQNDLEDALLLEANLEDLRETEIGYRLFKWLQKRHKVIARICKVLNKF